MSRETRKVRSEGWLEPELWLSRFANRLRVLQPQIDDGLALDAAKILLPMLSLEDPEDAVQIFLEVMRRAHVEVEAEVAQALQKIQAASRTDTGKGSGNQSA